MLETLWNSRINVIAVILFAIGLVTLLLHHNLFKKILGLNIMDTASCLLLTSMGYIKGRTAPIIVDGVTPPMTLPPAKPPPGPRWPLKMT